MFSNKLVKMNYFRRNTVSVITSTFKREILTQYKYKNCLSTSATSLYNAENGVNDDYDWMKGRKKIASSKHSVSGSSQTSLYIPIK